MKINNSKTSLFSLALFLVLPLLALPSSLDAQIGLRARRCNRCSVGRNNCARCPQCNEEFCQLKCDETKEKKTCYEVDYKTVCIPKVYPPWKKNCQPQCAEARSVKVLNKKTYECPRCNYSWEVVKPQLPEIVDPQAPVSQYQPLPWQGAAPQGAASQPWAQTAPPVRPMAPIEPTIHQRYQSVHQKWQQLDALKQSGQLQGTPLPAQPTSSSSGAMGGNRFNLPKRQQNIQEQGYYQATLGDQPSATAGIGSSINSATPITAAGQPRTAPQPLRAAGQSAAGANSIQTVPTRR